MCTIKEAIENAAASIEMEGFSISEQIKKWCEKYKVTEQDICERAVTSYLDYLRDCEEYLSKEKVDGCVVIKSTF